ncbi:preprotein translocase subunit SecG [Parachitinimonas caeni]|uniref:Protein-export membrane protein SecG n=1 Tax=Parachitinimonas caeni TaxID=3031301 RepID=A0ABT7DXK3_9NEIS|nr:preprotein translocase subunit SecG [Parachitinimonas caeni]MDK2124798.1 preprotein translocase subunit SecG [Parachitinimonas caeni]
MELFKGFIQVFNVLSAVGVIVLVLLQHGKGADMGAAFGSGSAGSLFGSSGSANFLSRFTAVCAIIFFSTCLMLVVVDSKVVASKGVMFQEKVEKPLQKEQAGKGNVIPN